MQCFVTHNGIPIGSVELDPKAPYAQGRLAPMAALGALRPILDSAIVPPRVGKRLLRLAPGARPDVTNLDGQVAEALKALAALTFELRNAHNALIPADMVRIIDAHDGRGVCVRAYFTREGLHVGAHVRTQPRAGHGHEGLPNACGN